MAAHAVNALNAPNHRLGQERPCAESQQSHRGNGAGSAWSERRSVHVRGHGKRGEHGRTGAEGRPVAPALAASQVPAGRRPSAARSTRQPRGRVDGAGDRGREPERSGNPGGPGASPGRQLDVLRVVVGAQVEHGVQQLDPLHPQHFHICNARPGSPVSDRGTGFGPRAGRARKWALLSGGWGGERRPTRGRAGADQG